jgi:hypothetical protein
MITNAVQFRLVLSSFKFIDVKGVFGLIYLSLSTIISTFEIVWKNLEMQLLRCPRFQLKLSWLGSL